MSVTTTLLVRDDLLPFSAAMPLEDVIVCLYDEDGTTFITEGQTNASGELTLPLEDDTIYWVRFFKSGYAFSSRLTITVDGDASSNIFDVVGRDLNVRPPATDPNLCRISGYLLNVAGAPTKGITCYFMRTEKPTVVGNAVVIPSKLYLRSDANGRIEGDLVRNGAYEFWIMGFDDSTRRVKVPDYPSVDFTDLVWPYVVSIELDVDTAALEVEVSAIVNIVMTLSNRVTVPYDLDQKKTVKITDFYAITAADPAIISVKVNPATNELTLIGKSAGSTTLVWTPIEGAIVERQPIPTPVIGSLVVTVT